MTVWFQNSEGITPIPRRSASAMKSSMRLKYSALSLKYSSQLTGWKGENDARIKGILYSARVCSPAFHELSYGLEASETLRMKPSK